jgi:hypothetical protein
MLLKHWVIHENPYLIARRYESPEWRAKLVKASFNIGLPILFNGSLQQKNLGHDVSTSQTLETRQSQQA